MEALKTLMNLPDSEKAKFFELLSCFNRAQNATAAIGESTASTEKSAFDILLGNQDKSDKGAENIEKNSTSVESCKKQRTLDGWLIRKKEPSPRKSKETNGSIPNINESVNSLDNILETNSSSVDNNVINSIDSSHNFLVETPRLREGIKQAENDKSLPIEASKSFISPNSDDTSFTLRRSKRKLYKLNMNDESGSSLGQSNENNSIVESTNRNKIRKDSDSSFLENKTVESKQPENLSVSTENLSYCDSDEHMNVNAVLLPEKSLSCEKSDYLNDLSESKTSYNLRTKRKLPKRLQDCVLPKVSNQNIEANLEDHMTTENYNNEANSSSDLNFEAYYTVSHVFNQYGLDIHDILRDKRIQNLLDNHENDIQNDGVLLFGTHKSNAGITMPVVHYHQSKSKLIETLSEVQKEILMDKKPCSQ